MVLRRRKCKKPPRIQVSEEELAKVKFPPKEKVIEKLGKLVKDEDVYNVIKSIEDTIYSMPEDSEFIKWIKSEAIRYKANASEERMIDYTLAISLAFVTYCKEQVYTDSTLNALLKKEIKPEDIKEPACLVVVELIESIRGTYVGANISRVKLMKLAYKWKKETEKIKKLMKKIADTWCLIE